MLFHSIHSVLNSIRIALSKLTSAEGLQKVFRRSLMSPEKDLKIWIHFRMWDWRPRCEF